MINALIDEIGLTEASTVSSLKYARTIQDAILCDRPGLRRLFGDFTIVYEPKNILGGDFYYYCEKHGYRYMAVCDCAGHGISAALLTILFHNLMERTLKKNPNLADAIDYLNKEICESIEGHSFAKSMDFVIAKIDDDNSIIEYCGAKRPLYLYRNGVLQKYKTARTSIGESYTFEFEVMQFNYKVNDRIFMFTDGYVDQFDDQDKKKFGLNKLKELLRAYGNRPHYELSSLLTKTLNDFRGTNVRTDDVLLLGLQL